jgi:hypothetical protein
MGMFNAIIPDELLHPRRVQGAPQPIHTLRRNATVTDVEAGKFSTGCQTGPVVYGKNTQTDLTESQTLQQCKM